MTDDKKKRLEEAGFRVGTIAEFLDLEPRDVIADDWDIDYWDTEDIKVDEE